MPRQVRVRAHTRSYPRRSANDGCPFAMLLFVVSVGLVYLVSKTF
jgi:hypothetical protein